MESVDILWHNSQSNETQIWLMNGGGDGIKRRPTVIDENGQKIFVGPPWSIVGASQGEIVWHNSQSNETQIWFIEGGERIKRRATVVDEKGQKIFVGPPWSIVGVSQGEIVWHNSQSNETQIWFMNEGGDGIKRRATVVDEKGQKIFVGLPWSIVGVSQDEIVWHNSQSSETQIWFMNGGGDGIKRRATVVDEKGQKIFVGSPWSIVGVSQGEIVWHNSQSNETQIWSMLRRDLGGRGGDGIMRRATVVDEKGQKIFVGSPWSIVATAPVFTLSKLMATQLIQQKYTEIGERKSPLGRPIDPDVKVQSSGQDFFRDFRGGQIKITAAGELQAFVTHQTVVRFRGIHCFGKSEAVDEPYAIVGVYTPDSRDVVTVKKFPSDRDSYTDFVASTDASESADVSPNSTGWAPQSLAISCTVMEHDSGDPDRAAASVEDALKKAANAAGAADEISVFTGILDDLKIPGLIADILGVGDDVIGSQVLQINIGDMVPKRAMQKFQNIEWNFDSPLLSDGNASYKLYFEVFVVENQPSKVL